MSPKQICMESYYIKDECTQTKAIVNGKKKK